MVILTETEIFFVISDSKILERYVKTIVEIRNIQKQLF